MLGFAIREYIRERQLDADFISDQAGIERQRFQDILNGTNSLEAVEYFHICRALGVSLNHFAEEETLKEEDQSGPHTTEESDRQGKRV